MKGHEYHKFYFTLPIGYNPIQFFWIQDREIPRQAIVCLLGILILVLPAIFLSLKNLSEPKHETSYTLLEGAECFEKRCNMKTLPAFFV
jgi:hypothetical protein